MKIDSTSESDCLSPASQTDAPNTCRRESAGDRAGAYTPYCNTGCTFRQNIGTIDKPFFPSSLDPASFRFDWYQATLDKNIEPFQALQWGQWLDDRPHPARAMHGYEVCHDYGQALISYGGKTGVHGVHVQIMGGDVCPELVQYLRHAFPVHRPSRIDVCMDFRGPEAWEQLSAVALSVASKFGIPTATAGDWIEGKAGRTLYLNPRKKGKEAPTFMARVYEKGHQLRGLGHVPDAPLDWVRLEFELHPPKHARGPLASASPDELARSSRWGRCICDRLGTVSAARVRLNTRRIKPHVLGSVETMLSQYAGVISEVKRDSWLTREEWMQVCGDLWDSGAYPGLPQSVRDSYDF